MSYDKFNLQGKTALITGAAGLLGIEHASALLESGATVVLTDVAEEALESAYSHLSKSFRSNNVISKIMDVSNVIDIRRVHDELSICGHHVDILINNAAIDPKVDSENQILEGSRLENYNVQQWDREISVGLTGAFLCSQVFGTSMAKAGNGGIILNIASDLSVVAPDQRLYRRNDFPDDLQPVKPVTYSVIKSGLVGLTRYLATYWAEQGIRSNALSPGGVLNGQGEEFVQRLNDLIPLGRMAAKDEYRGALQFLCSDASAYMNGQNVIIDGGRSVW